VPGEGAQAAVGGGADGAGAFAEDLAGGAGVQAARPDDVVVILVRSSSSAMHRMIGSVAVQLAHHAPVPVTIVP